MQCETHHIPEFVKYFTEPKIMVGQTKCYGCLDTLVLVELNDWSTILLFML